MLTCDEPVIWVEFWLTFEINDWDGRLISWYFWYVCNLEFRHTYFSNSDQTFWFLMKDKVNYCCATIKMPHIPLGKNSKENTQKSFGSMMLCFVIWNRDNRGQKEIGVVKMIQFLFLKVQYEMYIVDGMNLKSGRSSLKYFCCLTSMNKARAVLL